MLLCSVARLTDVLCRSKTQLLTLYFLDSGAYSKSFFDIFGFKQGLEYDWIHQVRLRSLALTILDADSLSGSNQLVPARVL